jgi:very-short-patch-repair endonuclease
MFSSPDALCATTARHQFGVINRVQALTAGLAPGDISYRLRHQRFQQVLPGVYSVNGVPASWERDLMAACLWAGETGCASHRAAARVLRLPGFGRAPIEISNCGKKRGNHLRIGDESPIVHRVDHHLVPEIIEYNDLPCTSARRTLIDLAGKKHPLLDSALDASIRRELTDIGQVWLLLEQEWMRGRRGVRVLRDLLVDRTPGMAPTDSELEIRMRRLLSRGGFPTPHQQYPIQLSDVLVHADFAFPEIKLAIECDSHAYHLNARAIELDRRRDNELSMIGWDVRRFTWAMVRFDEPHILRVLEPYRRRLANLSE